MLEPCINTSKKPVIPYIKRRQAPAGTPVTLDDVKNFLRVKHNQDDNIINYLMTVATEYAEWYMETSIMPQQWATIIKNQIPNKVYLKFGPVNDIASVTLYDGDNSRVLSSDEYSFDEICESVDMHGNNSGDKLEIISNTGYNNIADIPPTIKQGILHHIAGIFNNRENTKSELLSFCNNLYAPFRKLKIVL